MSLGGVISRFATGGGAYTVTRPAVGTYGSDGVHVAGAPSTFTITASIQPATGRQLMVLPEEQRAQEVRAVYTNTALLAKPGAVDRITIAGERWDVISVKTYENGDRGTHYEALIARQELTT